MVSFTLCLLALLAGYFIYGRFVEERWCGFPSVAHVENLYDSVLEHRRPWPYFWCHYGR